MGSDTPDAPAKPFLFIIDDGWRLETAETLRFLKPHVEFDIVTHDASTFEKLKGEFNVIRLHPEPLKGVGYAVRMFFAKELESQLLRTVQRIRFHQFSWTKKLLRLARVAAGRLGLRRVPYSRALEVLYRDSDRHGDLLKRYQAVFYSSVNVMDKRILFEAKRRGLPLICWVYSWDHPIKDNEFLPDALRYLVWNKEARDAIMRVHGVSEDRIRIVGPTQFDYLLRSREGLARPLPGRYVVFAGSLGRYPFHIEQELTMIRFVHRMLREVDPSVTLLVRPYPFTWFEDPYRKLEGIEGLVLKPFGVFEECKTVITPADEKEKLEQIVHAECYITIGSTIALEVSFAETPMLQINFNIPNEYPAWQDYREVLKNDHLRFIVDPGYPNIIENEEKLRDALRAILAGDREAYLPYSRMLQEFANPLKVSSYKQVLRDALVEIGKELP